MPTNKELEQKIRDLNKRIAELEKQQLDLRGLVHFAILWLNKSNTDDAIVDKVVFRLEEDIILLDGYKSQTALVAMQLIDDGHELEMINIKRQPITDMLRRERGVIHIHENGKPRFIGKGDIVYVKITKYPEPVSAEQDGVVEGGEGEGG